MGDIKTVVDGENLSEVWTAIANCVNKITGDVDPSTDGTLQKQINDLKDKQFDVDKEYVDNLFSELTNQINGLQTILDDINSHTYLIIE